MSAGLRWSVLRNEQSPPYIIKSSKHSSAYCFPAAACSHCMPAAHCMYVSKVSEQRSCDQHHPMVAHRKVERRVSLQVLNVGICSSLQQNSNHMHFSEPHRCTERQQMIEVMITRAWNLKNGIEPECNNVELELLMVPLRLR